MAGSVSAASLLQETDWEFITSADLNGDGRADIVLVDKATGRVRPGYQAEDGRYNWVEWRDSGVRGVTGMGAGPLFNEACDALAFASRDENQLSILDVSVPTTTAAPIDIPFMLLGPAVVAVVDVGGAANTPLFDLLVGSVYNSPDENVASLFRNVDVQVETMLEESLPGTPKHWNRIQLQNGGPGFLAAVYESEAGASFHIQSFADGEPVSVASLSGLPVGVNYTLASLGGSPWQNLLLWTPGSPTLARRAFREAPPASHKFGTATSHELKSPIHSVASLPGGSSSLLFIVQGRGETAGLYSFDVAGQPDLLQTFHAATNHLFTGALPAKDGFIVFQGFTNGGSSVRYQFFSEEEGQFKEGTYGRLPTLADNDKLTVPDIHARAVAGMEVSTEVEMQAYTNTIPGTKVAYVMVPIPGGELLMGSPASEAGHQPDEGPQHRVRVAPFWMGQYEITWKEYELFMHPDDEKKMRKLNATDEIGDALADAVTHPSKPYTDMTFGMGREGYPAIAMTQHAANKYCQWLSAKTGQFYRLPTEAEWEYAARAGTSTPYFFGDDESVLEDYAWYEMNSDFKYQKVGRKKPNPWGLHDIYGNVVEWVLDQYDPDYYAANASQGVVDNPWNKATKPYPLSVRGGSWDDMAEVCRSAARRGSDPIWKLQDPQLPKSVWYFTDADFVGFRIVRPLEVPSAEAMQSYWNNGVERE